MTAVVLRIAVLITCFNRKEKTLRCLQSLVSQLQFPLHLSLHPAAHSSQQPEQPLSENLAQQAQLIVYVLDNGNDGTFDAIAAAFPWVELSRGHPDLYWNSAMRQLWQQARAGEFDFYLWLNDDVDLFADAIPRLLHSYLTQTPGAGAVIGSMVAPHAKDSALTPTYGGRNRRSKLNPLAFGPVLMPTNESQPCTFINGNLCLIPQNVVAAVGVLSEHFSHGLGDFDYGLRLQKAGFSVFVAPGFYGECAVNPKAGSVLDSELPFAERLAMSQRPNVMPPSREWRYFVRLHGGPLWPLLWVKSWGRQLFPAIWLWLRQQRGIG